MKALLSVTDKRGIEEFAKGLEALGYEILSTGGTLAKIKEAGVSVKGIEEYTGFPEMLEGRVKTLHPKVHGGILYKRDVSSHVETVKEHGIEAIDLVCVNLYDFEGVLKQKAPREAMIENVDIGGPTLIRSSAKNYKNVLIVTDPEDYEEILTKLQKGEVEEEYRMELAMKAFSNTAYYDAMISRYFQEEMGKKSKYFTIGMKEEGKLRYGENPKQEAAHYTDPYVDSYLSDFEILQGKELSFNNLNDLNTAAALCGELHKQGGVYAVGLKHATPCGVAKGESVYDAYEKCFHADDVSIFGGIVAINGTINEKTAAKMNEIFLEVIAAKDFSEEALKEFSKKKNTRILKIDFDKMPVDMDIKYLNGEVLVQQADLEEDDKWEVVTKKSPDIEESLDLQFAMKVCKYVKSNAIVIVKDGVTLGIGGGQTSRIWALESIFNNHPDVDFTGSALASDAFFPFDDCVREASKHGVSAIIQPGGSIKDQDSVKACDEKGISMVLTGSRHFKH